MEILTPQQRLQIVQLYYENGRSVKSVYRALRPIYGVHNRPAERTIWHTIGKLENWEFAHFFCDEKMKFGVTFA